MLRTFRPNFGLLLLGQISLLLAAALVSASEATKACSARVECPSARSHTPMLKDVTGWGLFAADRSKASSASAQRDSRTRSVPCTKSSRALGSSSARAEPCIATTSRVEAKTKRGADLMAR